MKRLLWVVVAVVAVCLGAGAVVVRPAPEFAWMDSAGRLKPSRDLRGQPVVLLIAPSPRDWGFRSQVGQIQTMYERLAANNVVFVAAFTTEPGRIKSNIPFLSVGDGPRVGFEYQSNDRFAIAIIGRDGNLDYVSSRVVPAQRVFDIVRNSFVAQERLRRP
jgi:hypothetical protein